jgi:hypothetical protein
MPAPIGCGGANLGTAPSDLEACTSVTSSATVELESIINRLGYAHSPTLASSGKANVAAVSNGHAQSFKATVVRIYSGDQVLVVDKDTGNEQRLQLSSTRGPK